MVFSKHFVQQPSDYNNVCNIVVNCAVNLLELTETQLVAGFIRATIRVLYN